MKVRIIDSRTGAVKMVSRRDARILIGLKKARLAGDENIAPTPVKTQEVETPVAYKTRSVESAPTKGKGGRPRKAR